MQFYLNIEHITTPLDIGEGKKKKKKTHNFKTQVYLMPKTK